jgi:hypothetical protein
MLCFSGQLSKSTKENFSSTCSLIEYYVTNGDNERYRTSTAILRTTLAQLYTIMGDTPVEDKPQVREARTNISSSLKDLPDDQVVKLIVSQIQKTGDVTIIIDALDECSDCQHAVLALCSITEQAEEKKLQLLVTSRDHIRPLRTAFRNRDYVRIFDVHKWRSKLNDVIRLCAIEVGGDGQIRGTRREP